MSLVEHARRELELLGEDEWMKEGMLKTIAAFAEMGHSGGSASIAIPMLNDLLQHKNLTPLTNDPAEWIDQSSLTADGNHLWQSNRNYEAFSLDGGKTYYLLSERDAGVVVNHFAANPDGTPVVVHGPGPQGRSIPLGADKVDPL